MFSFNQAAEVSVSGSNFLQGDKIHEVSLKSIELKTIDSKSGQQYEIIEFAYEGADGGAFNDRVFVPNGPDAAVRKQQPWGGVGASEIERLMMKLYLVISVIDPTLYQDIRTKKQSLNFGSVAQLVDFMQKTLKGKDGTRFNAKLLKNKDGFAEFPRNYAKISKEGNLYMANIFLGDNVRFTKYEMEQIETRAAAKPEEAESFSLGSDSLMESTAADSAVEANMMPTQDSGSDIDLNF